MSERFGKVGLYCGLKAGPPELLGQTGENVGLVRTVEGVLRRFGEEQKVVGPRMVVSAKREGGGMRFNYSWAVFFALGAGITMAALFGHRWWLLVAAGAAFLCGYFAWRRVPPGRARASSLATTFLIMFVTLIVSSFRLPSPIDLIGGGVFGLFVFGCLRWEGRYRRNDGATRVDPPGN